MNTEPKVTFHHGHYCYDPDVSV